MKDQLFRSGMISIIIKGRVLLFLCLITFSSDVLAQTNVYIEAESATLLGTANITNCTNASGGKIVRDMDDGPANALELQGIIIPDAGNYFITISYFSLPERSLSYKINNGASTTVSLPSSGDLWCYQGGVPAEFTFKDDLISGENSLRIFDSPIIDKVLIRSDTADRKPATFYVSTSDGDDTNDGLSAAASWKTIDKVNVLELVPGDTLRFKSGDTFKGKLSIFNEGGAPGLPIIVTSYGDGSQPILDGDGYLSTIHVLNSGYLSFSDFKIKNDGGPAMPGDPEDLRYGVYIENSHADGTFFEHYRMLNLTFKNIYPTIEVTDDDNTGVNAHAIITSGSWGDDINPTRFKDMLIENCLFTRTARHATYFKAIDNLVIRNNLFEHVGGAGMVIGNNCTNILVEHNITNYTGSKIDPRMAGRGSGIWCFHSTNLTVQHNKFMYASGIHDSYGMHIDIGNRNVVYQYNYSEGNEGGFVEILGANVNVGYRYNLSVGDGWRKRGNRYGQIFWLAGWSGDPANPIGSDSIFVYNNSIYVRDSIAPGIWIEEVSKNARIYNNIIYVANQFGPVVIKNNSSFNDFDYNNWYGNIPLRDENGDLYRGPNAMTSDPKYMASIVSDAVGFILQEESPAIGSGELVHNAGIEHPYDYFHNNGGEDYYGNQVFPDAQPNIGAYNVGGDKVITGINKNNFYDLNDLYPNPLHAGKTLTIRVPSNIKSERISVQLIEMTGKVGFSNMYENRDQIIVETSTLKKGCYVVCITGAQLQFSKKLIIL